MLLIIPLVFEMFCYDCLAFTTVYYNICNAQTWHRNAQKRGPFSSRLVHDFTLDSQKHRASTFARLCQRGRAAPNRCPFLTSCYPRVAPLRLGSKERNTANNHAFSCESSRVCCHTSVGDNRYVSTHLGTTRLVVCPPLFSFGAFFESGLGACIVSAGLFFSVAPGTTLAQGPPVAKHYLRGGGAT